MTSADAEYRDRVRAMGLWFVAAIVVVGAFVGIYALFVGFDRTVPARVEAVAPGETPADLVVRYTGGSPGCGDPGQVVATESAEEVVLTAHTVIVRGTRVNLSCDDQGIPLLATVRLASPLGERTVRDAYDDSEVEVLSDVGELVGDG